MSVPNSFYFLLNHKTALEVNSSSDVSSTSLHGFSKNPVVTSLPFVGMPTTDQ